ncbi:NADH dehydrogenase [ubiquinone] 1 alpha subcomplex subunit [Wickerhamomyces ciferrii]|uniref:NADH dehydrogenase [ubiquinone] 1 alpha subcomplex subunit 13 n=1 Tax=Wickerhamomyces ciferrii (strain ATCC 14091 / BCRC 22168 / CBS 111 / JCM 3599 / NBRC 0793 / NRRL Y-1031 F-60-10) TaxID=1206466 RepID=K0KK40_WICCF|nr:NADH dehydrogenase [ubiquinone] 1 alpha subcomplex subunit [Wickerhamomyces ciferrii]CCH41829.1 NADH dehydrogenase [ubiquinone] 1 alpha subcomplex subunit [Wickerhamomyces ciferrii]
MPQDLPPIGGYDPIQWKRNLPTRGFRPKIVLGVVLAITGYGWYEMARGISERRELQREKIWARIHLMPLLIAEFDRDSVRRYYADKAREAEIMKDVEGWVPKQNVYNDGRFRNPVFAWGVEDS